MSSSVDDSDRKSIVASCGCAVEYRPPGHGAPGVSLFFCAEHSAHNVPVVYDSVAPVELHPAIEWDYTVHSS